MKNGIAFTWLILAAGSLGAAAPATFEQFCFKCHDATQAEGDLDLEAFVSKKPDAASVMTLEDILLRIREGDMPPAKTKKQPGDAQKAEMTAWAQHQLDAMAEASMDDPGVVMMQRLTRAEYRRVIRDLSGGIVLTAGEYLPNEGGAGEGFANVGEAQSMAPAVLEKYLEAAKGALRHLRVSPAHGLVWSEVPHDAVDEPAAARQEAIDELIAWHVAQQAKWGRDHREHLKQRLGFNDAAYLEAAWRWRWRVQLGRPDATFADIARGYDAPLAPVVLEKWHTILSAPEPEEPFATWAAAWQMLGADTNDIRQRCIAIVAGKAAEKPSGLPPEGYAPPYEISFHEAITEVIGAATERGVWPFRIEIGDAKELFFVVTDAGDGATGEFASWRAGRFQMADGTAKPWQEASKVTGANSGREFPFGRTHDGRAVPPDAIGVQPPGALRVTVPPGAVTFELELALDRESFGRSSVQAIVLKEKPESQSYIPGRMVFGGKKSGAREAQQDARARELERALRKRNIYEGTPDITTKRGLSSELNIFAAWTRCSRAYLGAPWQGHIADKAEPLWPYHLTVEQVRHNATKEDLDALRTLEDRLAAIVQAPQQDLLALLKGSGIETAREGAMPDDATLAKLPEDARARAKALREQIVTSERQMEPVVAKMLGDFARRAWRRDISTGERELLTQLYREAREQGVSFDGAMKAPLLAALASPHFIYRAASTGPEVGPHPRPLSRNELATRVSFFLWSSLPDEELLAADVTNPDVMKAQAMRLLHDTRASSLAEVFAAQMWLFEDFEHFTGPDGMRFPEFTAAMRQQMLMDVTSTLNRVFMHDAPLRTLLDENCLATKPIFLTKTSLPLRTSPVQRGVWIVETLIGRRIPPPPPNVPQLSPEPQDNSGLTIPQQLARHREDPNCASCHDKIDPPGLMLENYDPIGRWQGAQAEAQGTAELKKWLLERQDEFQSNFHRKLLGYALGRAVLPGDKRLLERMRGQEKFSELVSIIVSSPQFTSRRASSTTGTTPTKP